MKLLPNQGDLWDISETLVRLHGKDKAIYICRTYVKDYRSLIIKIEGYQDDQFYYLAEMMNIWNQVETLIKN